MKKWFVLPSLALCLTTVTNCSPYSQVDNSSLDALGDLSCPATSNKCVTPNPDNLSITVNLMNNANQILLAAQTDFNIAGDCNEGGYPSNVIQWELYDGQVKLRDSAGLGYNAVCTNGRFMMYVTLGSVSTDPVNRTGGVDQSGVKKNYQLRYYIRGVGAAGYVLGANSTKSINLLPRSI